MGSAQQLDGWKAIAAFLRVSVKTARRWASRRIPASERLPVERRPSPVSTRVVATAEALEAWEKRRRPVVTND